MGSDNFMSKYQLSLTTFIIYIFLSRTCRMFILKPVLLFYCAWRHCSLIFAIEWCYLECLVKKIPSVGTIWLRLRASALELKGLFHFLNWFVLDLCKIQTHGEGQTKPYDCATQHWIWFTGIVPVPLTVELDFSNTNPMGLIYRDLLKLTKMYTSNAKYSTLPDNSLGSVWFLGFRKKLILTKFS